MTKSNAGLPEDVELSEEAINSPLYSEDLKPVPPSQRTWGMWDLAAIWVGMAVCIPTYLLASYMIKDGFSWKEALAVIALGNIIVTIPMVLNGHSGLKYGVPFPVIGRSSFGVSGIHLASVLRGIVACGWFGIQTWIGGLAIYSIGCVLLGVESSTSLSFGQFVGFALFWLMNVFFIWKGTESIRWLEKLAAPLLILIGIAMIWWGAQNVGSFGKVLDRSAELSIPTAVVTAINEESVTLSLNPVRDASGEVKATHFKLRAGDDEGSWQPITNDLQSTSYPLVGTLSGKAEGDLQIQFKSEKGTKIRESSAVGLTPASTGAGSGKLGKYLLWLTAMVGFWATMAISIADITRYGKTQRQQVMGQFIGLPGTMVLYSFVGVFVTCAAAIIFGDVLVLEDAPWDPVSLVDRLDSPGVIIVAQLCMLIATLSTNIAANVIAPANAFSNIWPRKISFRKGGIIAALIGIVICPWWLLDEIAGLLLFVSSFLGPILAILVCDYFSIRKKRLSVNDLFLEKGAYSYSSGFNSAALIALLAGVGIAFLGWRVPSLSILYNTSWFSSFLVAYVVYYFLAKAGKP